jgi:hypothetical protein
VNDELDVALSRVIGRLGLLRADAAVARRA